MEDYNKLVEIVNVLEQEVFEQTEGIEYFNFEVVTNGFATIINFIGLQIWNSEDDDRNYYDETDSYEPMDKHLRRILNTELDKLRMLKF